MDGWRWMDGWMDRWAGGWVDGQMDEKITHHPESLRSNIFTTIQNKC
jgi:hypothetical protein